MKRYIIRTGEGDAFNAASKARQDAEAIALRRGYEPFPFQGKRTADQSITAAIQLAVTGYRNWKALTNKTQSGDIVLIQYPHYPMKSAYLAKAMMKRAQKNHVRFIALIHDLDSLRGYHGKAARYSDAHLLPLFDAIIYHNERMKEYLVSQNIPKNKLIPLEIFDYLTTEKETPDTTKKTNTPATQTNPSKTGLAIAGNLDPDKTGYIQKLINAAITTNNTVNPSTTTTTNTNTNTTTTTATTTLPLHLYGKGLKDEDLKNLPPHVTYHGSFPPAELPEKLEGCYGLVWDGPEITTCAGKQGAYLKYNNPHKLSLYLAAGLPVILWSGAAEADFVRRTHTGVLTDSLTDIRFPDNEDELKKNAETLSRDLRAGKYLTQALEKAEQLLAE